MAALSSAPRLRGRKGNPASPKRQIAQSSPVIATAPVRSRTENARPSGVWVDPKDATQHLRDFDRLPAPDNSTW